MGQVNVSIAGRAYRIACNDGEEEHLKGLGARLDGKISELRETFGEIGDARITVMAAITIADQLSEAERRIAGLEEDIERLRGGQAHYDAQTAALADRAAEAIEEAASRIDRIAQALNAPVRDDAARE